MGTSPLGWERLHLTLTYGTRVHYTRRPPLPPPPPHTQRITPIYTQCPPPTHTHTRAHTTNTAPHTHTSPPPHAHTQSSANKQSLMDLKLYLETPKHFSGSSPPDLPLHKLDKSQMLLFFKFYDPATQTLRCGGGGGGGVDHPVPESLR